MQKPCPVYSITSGFVFLVAISSLTLAALAQPNEPSPPPPAPPSSISLNALAWNIRYSPGMSAHPSANGEKGWYFDFPVYLGSPPNCSRDKTCSSVHYITTSVGPSAINKTLSAAIQINTAGPTVFNYQLNPDNTCIYPAHVRLFFERQNSLSPFASEFYRWWSNPVSYELMAGTVILTAPLTPDQWSSVYGKLGSYDRHATAAFEAALQNIDSVGLAFGGGCFFGHGVNVNGGTAHFKLINYK